MNRTILLSGIAAITLGIAGASQAQSTRADRAATAGLPPAAAVSSPNAVQFATAMPADASGSLVLPLAASSDLAQRAGALDAATRDAINRALTSAEFKYGAGKTLSLRGIGNWSRILIVGLGATANAADVQTAGAVAGRALMQEAGAVTVLTEGLSPAQGNDFATGMGLGEYRSDLYRTAERQPTARGATTLVGGNANAAQALYQAQGRALVDAMLWARDISNEPANVVYPQVFVERARAAFSGIRGVTIEVLDEVAMQRLGMGAILGVGRGSERPPRMLIIRYRGQGAPATGPVVLAGKGITFDSGGISIKPSTNMGNMKFDMAGAASVTGAVLSLARSGAPVDVVAIAALAENMPGGSAIRPGDVLRAMNGRTIEIGSTDAEGRLVLADALSYAQAQLRPAAVVDVATLTGAVGGALGNEYAGLFSRHPALAAQLTTAGSATGEELWQLPLHPSYAEDTGSTIADLKNGGGSGAGAGVGAYFIGEFVNRTTPWAHIDMANVGWNTSATDRSPAGAAGWGVRLLDRFVRDFAPVTAQSE
jgi:leucyl aminopeptidase